MSDMDQFVEQKKNKEVITQPTQLKLKLFYQQFTFKVVALLLTVTLAAGLTYALFYQYKSQNNALKVNQLIPLTQQLKYLERLQTTDELISGLLNATNAENFTKLHNNLIANNNELLKSSSRHGGIFQQWLNENKLAEDIALRLQDSNARNQELKHSSISQLQLMLLSTQAIIVQQLLNQDALEQELQVAQASNKATYSSANLFVSSARQLHRLQQLKSLLMDAKVGFDQLNILMPIENFEYFRIKVEQLIALYKQVNAAQEIKTQLDLNQQFTQQFDVFEKIVLTQQSALAKWQGYIRLAHSYRLGLVKQQQKIRQLLAIPYQSPQIVNKSNIEALLSQLNVSLSAHHITLLLTLTISVLMALFVFLLWQLRKQIHVSAQHSVALIKSIVNKPQECLVANCAETQELMQLVKNMVKPLHSEDEFQVLSKQYQSLQKLVAKQAQVTDNLIVQHQQLTVNIQVKNEEKINEELRRYSALEASILRINQEYQKQTFEHDPYDKVRSLAILLQLSLLSQQLAQYHLALAVKSKKFRLILKDINLIAELHAILFNKQQIQQVYNNQLIMRCDQHLLSEVKIDFRLFQQLINLFIDIILNKCTNTKLYLQVQLQDKNVGQQKVSFSATVTTQSLDILPDLATQLIDSQSTLSAASPLINAFLVFFEKQHGENIVAQLVEHGYQLSFELPLAITSSIDNADEITLINNTIMLISNNVILSEVIEQTILCAHGKFKRVEKVNDVEQFLSEKQLKKAKFDVLVVTSDIALSHLDYLNEVVNKLPDNMRPKLMVLQSKSLSYERFGFYNQAEQVFCKDTFIENILNLLASNKSSNQLFTHDFFTEKLFVSTQIPLLLAVSSPQQYQNLQRLLQWLGLQVQVVAHEAAQKLCWETGQYSLLISEFSENVLVEMINQPRVNIGIFSLSDSTPNTSKSAYFDGCYQGKLTKESTLVELIEALTPWLTPQLKIVDNENDNDNDKDRSAKQKNDESTLSMAVPKQVSKALVSSDDFVSSQIADVYTNNKHASVFNFFDYAHNQGAVELALFMLDDYSQNNHLQFNGLIEAINTKNTAEAELAINRLTLNAKILAAPRLQVLCSQWAQLLNCSEFPNHKDVINNLIKDTQQALNDIDAYAAAL